MRLRILLIFIAAFPFQNAFCQKSSYFKRVFVDAEYYLLYEEYRDALPLYQEIYKAYPSNCNLAYRIGLCYLNIPNEKKKSLPYFEKAITSITPSYQEGYFTETKAPREAFLRYGQALRIDSQFDKAMEAFKSYQNLLTPKDLLEQKIIAREIESIAYARKQLANPASHTIKPVNQNVNTRFPEVNPLSDTTGNLLIYTSLQQFYNAILVSQRKEDLWTNPINLNAQLFADGAIKTVGISPNGNMLILARNDNDTYNLYFSRYDRTKNTWSPIEKFPKEINSSGWEISGSLSSRGDTLYFSSNRAGGFGGFDIYMSVKTITGWSNPVNLGNKVNTPFDEISPFVSENGKQLFFSSNGHRSMGGFDLCLSGYENKTWGLPHNLGYPINTLDDDTFLFPLNNGKRGFISRASEESSGEDDIYEVTLDLSTLLNGDK